MTARVTPVAEIKAARLRPGPSLWLWAALLGAAGLPRLWAAFQIPNPEGDAYAYLETIERMRAGLVAGTFSIKSLFSFWLPMYQFACALVSVPFNHPVYVSKLVSAICGTGVCALVFLIAWRLTGNRPASLIAALFVALSPLHILYSAFSLTEVPHALAVLGSLYATIRGRWTAAAVCAGMAGFMRVESWMLIALLPAFELIARRRVSLLRCGLLLVAPLVWLAICWAATGDWLAYFHERSRYINSTIATYPHLQSLSWARLWQNAHSLIHSANPVVLLGSLAAAALLIRQLILTGRRGRPAERLAVAAAAVFFFAYLSFLIAAFLTGNQPDLWDRYGLIFFSNGMPLAAWAGVQVTRRRRRLAVALAMAVLAVCVWEIYAQTKDAGEIIRRTSPQLIVAGKLYDAYMNDRDIRVLCDDAVVRRLSEIPRERFITSADLPVETAGLLADLDRRGVDYLVYQEGEEGAANHALAALHDGPLAAGCELVAPAFMTDWHGRVYLYRIWQADSLVGRRDPR